MPDDADSVHHIERREAQSGNVSYGDPVVLHDTSRSRVILVPFFIHRSDGTELAVKLVTYRKANPPESWVVVKEKSLSLQESTARQLLRALREHLAVAEHDENGSYLAIPVSGGAPQLRGHDPSEVAAALTRALSEPEIIEHLFELDLSAELTNALRAAVRLSEMRSAVAQLRELLERGETDERIYQAWCQSHTWAFGNAYVMRDDVREISPGDQLDLLLPTVFSGHRDIVELKKPDRNVLLYDDTHRNYYFSSDVSKAIGQCHRYLDVLHEEAARGLRDHPEIVAYHPRAIIVIGRSSGWSEEQLKALHGLNQRLSGVTVMTYDHLLAQGERLLQILDSETEESENTLSQELETWDDDLPL